MFFNSKISKFLRSFYFFPSNLTFPHSFVLLVLSRSSSSNCLSIHQISKTHIAIFTFIRQKLKSKPFNRFMFFSKVMQTERQGERKMHFEEDKSDPQIFYYYKVKFYISKLTNCLKYLSQRMLKFFLEIFPFTLWYVQLYFYFTFL